MDCGRNIYLYLEEGCPFYFVLLCRSRVCRYNNIQIIIWKIYYTANQRTDDWHSTKKPWHPFWYNDHLSRYREIYNDKTVVRQSYLYNGNSCFEKTAYLYWDGLQFPWKHGYLTIQVKAKNVSFKQRITWFGFCIYLANSKWLVYIYIVKKNIRMGNMCSFIQYSEQRKLSKLSRRVTAYPLWNTIEATPDSKVHEAISIFKNEIRWNHGKPSQMLSDAWLM